MLAHIAQPPCTERTKEMHMNRTADRMTRALVLSTLMALPACGELEMDETDGGVAKVSSPLYGGGTLSKLWIDPSTGGPIPIPVCFTQPGFAAQRTSTRDTLLDTWARVGNMSFTGWGTCPSQNQPNTVRVTFAKGPGGTFPLGRNVNGATGVTITTNDTNTATRYQTMHEFGHALGFAHDQERPDNWSNGQPVYCPNTQEGVKDRPGGNYYNNADNRSIMSYCAGTATALSGGDVAGLRGSYGSSQVMSCQKLSDTYGMQSGNLGFAPQGRRSQWILLGCTTSPSSPDTCQKASDLFGIDAGVTFGFAPSGVRTWWQDKGCQTRPRSSIGLCQRASDTYGISAGQTWETAPTEVQTWWINAGCNTSTRNQDSCQHISDEYGVSMLGNVLTAGWAPTSMRSWFMDHGCQTSATTANTCQQLSDLFGMRPGVTGAAPTAARTWWNSNNCSTTPLSTNSCQRASDFYGIVAGVSFGFAPIEVQQWWTSSGCNTKPTHLDRCQTMSDRFGISTTSANAAPPEVVAWWNGAGCNTRPRDVRGI
jgi:hypothetical protein